MITKSDWQTVNEQLLDEDRRRVGDPPTAEEMLAYSRRELPADDEARVREKLVAYPDLMRSVVEPFPTVGAKPGEPDYVSDAEFAMRFAAMKKKGNTGEPERGNVVQFWRVATALAAAVALLFGTMLWRTSMKVMEPRAVSQEQLLDPEVRRGPAPEPTPVRMQGESILLLPKHLPASFDAYRFEIVRLDSNRTVWKSAAMPRTEDTIGIIVPREFLRRGDYRIVAYGIGGGAEERVGTYLVRLLNP